MGLLSENGGQASDAGLNATRRVNDRTRRFNAIGATGTFQSYVSPQSGRGYTITVVDSRGGFQLSDSAGTALLTCRSGDCEHYSVLAPTGALAEFSYTSLLPGNTVRIGSERLTIASDTSAFLSDGMTSASIASNGTTAATFIFRTSYGSGSKLVGAPPHASVAAAASRDEFYRRPAIAKGCSWSIQDFVVALICAISAGMAVEAGIGLFAFGLSTYATVSEFAHLRA